jgi:hypothetical protein
MESERLAHAAPAPSEREVPAVAGREVPTVNDTEARRQLVRVKRGLRRYGLLPFSDGHVPSVVSIVSGSPIAGSWWGHPSGASIYRVGELIDEDRSILVLKLWRGKVTLVHRRLWPSLVRIGRARSGWQLAGVAEAASRLLEYIDHEGTVRGDQLPPDFDPHSRGLASSIRVLERRLLILTRSVHTPSGAHALVAESWRSWSRRARTSMGSGSVAAAERAIEVAARSLAPGPDLRLDLPWLRSG